MAGIQLSEADNAIYDCGVRLSKGATAIEKKAFQWNLPGVRKRGRPCSTWLGPEEWMVLFGIPYAPVRELQELYKR